jgi:hypothetical protein
VNLYLKNNSFDPLRCQDIPRTLSDQSFSASHEGSNIASAAEKSTDLSQSSGASHSAIHVPKFGRRSRPPLPSKPVPCELDVPKSLLKKAETYAELVKARLGEKAADFKPKIAIDVANKDKQNWARHY